MKKSSLIEAFVRDTPASAVVLDRDGRILDVCARARQVVHVGTLTIDKSAIGENYLKHAALADSTSTTMLKGLKAIIARKYDVFSTLYCCAPLGWFMLLAFAIENHPDAAAAVVHLELSDFLPASKAVSAAMIGTGPAALDPAIERVAQTVRQTIASSLQFSSASGREVGNPREQKIINSLTDHQISLLVHLARGASNAEIAKAKNISVGSVKNQTAALLRKLGVDNRVQAALLAIRNRLLDERE
jgi:DNA-binding CsgD family transcriptional regulator